MSSPGRYGAYPRSIAVAVSLVTVLAGVALIGGCGSSGRELREPAPDKTAPPRKQSPAGTASSSTTVGALTVFGLTTDAWSPGGTIPDRFTCDGEDISPPLNIFTVPAEAVELALVVTDLDTGGYAHWVVANLPPSLTSIAAGEVPAGAVQARTTGGGEQYAGPCPPDGVTHLYEFALYALSSPSGVTPGQDAQSAIAMIVSDPLELATMTGEYQR